LNQKSWISLHGRSDSESGHPGQSSEDNKMQLGNQVLSHSVSHDKMSVSPSALGVVSSSNRPQGQPTNMAIGGSRTARRGRI